MMLRQVLLVISEIVNSPLKSGALMVSNYPEQCESVQQLQR